MSRTINLRTEKIEMKETDREEKMKRVNGSKTGRRLEWVKKE